MGKRWIDFALLAAPFRGKSIMNGLTSPNWALWTADGTGRDMYIRRDPVVQYGKTEYKSDSEKVTRFGSAGSALPRDLATKCSTFQPGQRDEPVTPNNDRGDSFLV